MRTIFTLLAVSTFIFGGERVEYFNLLKDHPQLGVAGDFKKGEIELIKDLHEIERIEKAQTERLLKKGLSKEAAQESSRVGVVAEDVYWIWLRDAVSFPTGAKGTYDRLLWKSSLDSGYPGVAVLPQMGDGRFALNLNYRHATRSWELEIPRGSLSPQESLESAANREVREETGLLTKELILLGVVSPDSGTIGSLVPVFLGKVDGIGASEVEESEAIEGIRFFTYNELKEGVVKGSLRVEIGKENREVPLRDSFITYALFQLMARGLN